MLIKEVEMVFVISQTMVGKREVACNKQMNRVILFAL